MKSIISVLLLSCAAFAQNHTIQIELVDDEVGYAIHSSDFTSCGTSSNDPGLNAIFQNHNVDNYCSAGFTSYPEIVWAGGGLIDCYGCDPNLLIADLEAYNTVIGRARLTPGSGLFANYIHIKMTPTNQIGTTPENVVITPNPALNEIFENFTVFHFQNQITNWHSIICDCYSPDLIAELLNQGLIMPNTVDPETGQVTYDNYNYDHITYLNAQNHSIDQIKVYPNPFRENLQISSNSIDLEYILYDISGKVIARVFSPDDLKIEANKINPGIYLLKMVHASKIKTLKLIKQ